MYSFKKSERLCSKKLIGELLISNDHFVKYPFRVVFKISSKTGNFPARIAISVSKKRFKRAVKRNRIKRLTREAFRLNKTDFYQHIPPGETLDILFIYLDNHINNYRKIEKSMKDSMQKILTVLLSDSQITSE